MAHTEPVVIVGGGPAALAVARGYRAARGSGPVTMLSAEARPPYRRPPLTKEYLRGRIGASDLLLEDLGWFSQRAVDLRCGTRAVRLDPARRVVLTVDGDELAFDECVLCTGSEPVRPPVPGAEGSRVHVIRTVEDAAAVAAVAHAGARIVVIGSGFIGCEAAASLAMRGALVTMVTPEHTPQDERLGREVGDRLRAWLTEAGVEVVAEATVTEISEPGEGGLRILLEDGDEISCDRVVLGTGVRPRTALAESAGLAVEDGAVPTDPSMRTAIEGVRCAGDLALAHNPTAGRRLRVEHWGEALAQGEVAGRAIAGEDAAWDTVPGFWSTIGLRTIKQAAWGDGWDEVLVDSDADGFTAWYGKDARVVGVVTHERDGDYVRGRRLVATGAAWPPR